MSVTTHFYFVTQKLWQKCTQIAICVTNCIFHDFPVHGCYTLCSALTTIFNKSYWSQWFWKTTHFFSRSFLLDEFKNWSDMRENQTPTLTLDWLELGKEGQQLLHITIASGANILVICPKDYPFHKVGYFILKKLGMNFRKIISLSRLLPPGACNCGQTHWTSSC